MAILATNKGNSVMSPMVYSVTEACELARMSRSVFYEALNAGALKAIKRGARTLVLASELERYLGSLPQLEVKHPTGSGASTSEAGGDTSEDKTTGVHKRRRAA
jgi:excisionase family DNA binding protein